MGLFDFLRRTEPLNQYQDPYLTEQYDIQSIGNIVIPEKLTDENCFMLSNSVAELFFPIDFYADRISKLRFYIGNKSGKEVESNEYNRLLKEINPLYKFSDLIYQYVFSYLADGNAIVLRQKPSSYSTARVTANNLSRVDVLRPDEIALNEYLNINQYEIQRLTDLIRYIDLNVGNTTKRITDMDLIVIDNYSTYKRKGSTVLSRSPLFAANKSIDTLMAVYSARYNVYANNGAAGYLSKKISSSNTVENIIDPANREKILADINNRNGLTGKRNIWGISSVPLEFVKTLATISELLPLEETLESSVKIAGVFQIPPVLVPRKDQSTYDNQANAEKTVWENGLLSIAETVCENWSKILGLVETPYRLYADTSTVAALTENESLNEDLKKKKIDNEIILYEKGIIKYNLMLENLGLETIVDGDKYIYEMEKVPYALKLGVGGTQALQSILSDSLISDDTKRNTLIVIFGLSEEEATQILSKNGKK